MKRSIDVCRTRTVEVTTRTHATINGEQLREMLKAAGVLVPPGGRLYFRVPGGGDWSNTDIDISVDTPIHVEWLQTEVK